MELFTIHNRYRLRKTLGRVGNLVFFAADDSLKEGEVLCAIAAFPYAADAAIIKDLLCYYDHLGLWSRQAGADWLCPLADFGELILPLTPVIKAEFGSALPENSEKPWCCYWIGVPGPLWKFFDKKESPHKLCRYLPQILKGLAWLHEQGFLYYNLSPWSILYNVQSPLPEIRFLYAGLVLPEHKGFATAAYTAPEVAEGRGCPASDLFSLGATCYSLTTGELPDEDQKHNLAALQKMQVPDALSQVILRMLQPDLNARFADDAEALAAVSLALKESYHSLSPRNYLFPVRFQEVPIWPRLKESLQALTAPPKPSLPIAYLLQGGAGEGKTTLLQECQKCAAGLAINTMTLPLGPRTGLLGTPWWKIFPPSLLAECTADIPPNHPELRLLSSVSSPEEQALHTQACLVQWLLENAKKPLLLLLDNLEWASLEIFHMLESLLKAYSARTVTLPKGEPMPRLLVIAFAASFAKDSLVGAFWQRLAQSVSLKNRIILEVLPSKSLSVENILAEMLHVSQAPQNFAAQLRERTQDNSLHMREIVARLLQEKKLYQEDGAWYLDAKSMEGSQLTSNLAEAILAHGKILPDFCQTLLQILPQLGVPVRYHTLAGLFAEKAQLLTAMWKLYRENWLSLDEDFRVFLASASVWKTFAAEESTRFPCADSMLAEHHPEETLLRTSLQLHFPEQFRSRLEFCAVLEILRRLGWTNSLRAWLDYAQRLFKRPVAASAQNLTVGERVHIAHIALESARYETASDCMQPVLEQGENQTTTAGLITMANVALAKKDSARINECLAKLKTLLHEDEPCIELALYHRLKAEKDVKQRSQHVGKSLEVLKCLMEESSEPELLRLLCATYGQILAHDFITESLPQGKKWLDLGLRMAERIHFLPLSTRLFWLSGNYQKNRANYSEALENFQKSLELAQKLCYPINEIEAILGIGDTYLALECHEKAQGCLRQAMLLIEKWVAPQYEGYASLLWARFWWGVQKTEEARTWCRKASSAPQPFCKGMALALHAEICASTAVEEAKVYWQEANFVAEQYGYPRLKVYLDLVKARLEIYHPDNADNPSRQPGKMLEVATKYELIEYLWQGYYQRGCAYQNAGDMSQALENFEKAWQIIEGIAEKLSPELRDSYVHSNRVEKLADTVALFTSDLQGNMRVVSKESPNKKMPSETAIALDKVVSEYQKELEVTTLNKLREQNENLHKLLELNKKLNSEHHLRALLDLIMDTAIEITHAERGFLILTEREQTLFEAARNFEREDVDNPQFEISHSITAKVIKTGIPVLSTDALEDEQFDGYSSVSELQLHSVLAVPLKVKDQVIGALYIDNRFEKGIFSETEKSVLEAFADQSALAIHNARLLEENVQKQQELTQSAIQIETLNKELAAANARLTQKVEYQKQELQETKEILQRTKSELSGQYVYERIIGKSSIMQEVFKILEKVADKNIPVLICGESGTGKELVAKAIHCNSGRRDKTFLSENCASMTDTLLESELFGHVKGAFTGAYTDKKGLFELANHGTLFLDEVGDMSRSMQADLLRVLETNQIRRIGGKEVIPVDVRIISASNQDLKDLVAKQIFREDLFFRLKVVQIDLPPLRKRKEDIPLLVEHFLEEYARENNCAKRGVDRKTFQAFANYDWPGNVRELRNVLYNVLSLHDEKELGPQHFQELLTAPKEKLDFCSEELSIDDYARRFVLTHQGKHNDSQLAHILGISRKTLWEKRKKWALFRNPGRKEEGGVSTANRDNE